MKTPPTIEAPKLGEVVADGRYELLARLGEGGSSVVYRAHDHRQGIDVALKLLLPRYVGRPEREQRLINEAEYLQRLRGHSHIIEFVDAGRLYELDAWPYLATELLTGKTLDLVFVRGKLEIAAIIDMARQVADALRICHAADIVHRDATPSNVFVLDDPAGAIKLFDFSHAGDLRAPRLAVGAPGRLTGQHDIPGTIGYMGPEQVRQEPADSRMDVFGFGVLLFELVTRQNPYAHIQDRGAFIQAQRDGSLDAPRLNAWAHGVPEELAVLVHDCTQALEQRPPMGEVLDRLQTIAAKLAGGPGLAAEPIVDVTVPMDPLPVIAQHKAAAIGAWGPPPDLSPAPEPRIVAPVPTPAPAPTPDNEPDDEGTSRLAFARPPQLRPLVVEPAPVPVPTPPIVDEPEPDSETESEPPPPLGGGHSSLLWIAASVLLLAGAVWAGLAWLGTDGGRPESDMPVEAAPLAPRDDAPAAEPVPEIRPRDLEPVPEIAPAPEPAVEPKPKPVPEIVTEPKPAVEAKPKPASKPQVEPESEPQSDPCDGVVEQAEQALTARDWRRAISLSTNRKCWKSQADRTALRVTAFAELGEWSKCVDAGANASSPEVRAKVDGCRMFIPSETSP